MKIDKKKLERQELGVEKWFNSALYGAVKNMQGCLHYFTGVGKTYTAILCMKRLFRLDSTHNIVVLVPSEVLVKQWNKILNKLLTKQQNKQISVFTWSWVLNNDIKIKTNTLIVDELHEFLSEEAFKTIDGTYIKYDNNLGLTATYEDKQNRHKKLVTYPIIDEINEIEALEKGFISPYIEFNLSLTLTDKEKEQYEAYSKVIGKNLSKFGGNLNLATKCLRGGVHTDGIRYKGSAFVYGWATRNGWRKDLDLTHPGNIEINDQWNPYKVFGYATTLMNSIRKRKDLLYSCDSKLQLCLDIVKRFPNMKSIIFSQSTEFADKLNLLLNEEGYSSVVYHSKLKTELRPGKQGKLIKFGKTRLKKEAIDFITTGKAKRLCASSSLDKGLDVPDLSLGITASGTSNFTQYKQRGGRLKRLNLFDNHKVALLINLYIKDTKDETWLKSRQSKSTNLIYWVDSLDEITFNPVNKNEFNLEEL